MSTFNVWMDIPLCAEAKVLLGGYAQFVGPIVNPAAELLTDIERAQAAIVRTNFPGIEDTFRRAPQLKVVARTGIGYDNIDVEAATRHGICVVNAPDAPSQAVAEFTFALILSVMRRLALADRRLRAGIWKPIPDLVGMELHGKALGLVGFGRTGSRVAKIAQAFGMTISAYDPYMSAKSAHPDVSFVDELPLLLQTADIISLHVPLNAQTRGLIGQLELALMKPSAILINVARGPVLDEQALADALQAGHLAGAGIDVWGQEPLLSGSPLLQLDNVVGAPHLAGTTAESIVRSHTTAAEAVLMVMRAQQPPTLVNPEVWERRR